MRSFFGTSALLVAFALFSALPTGAQEGVTAPRSAERPAPPPAIVTLHQALEQTPWDPEPRGPLLVVAPGSTYFRPTLPPTPPGGYRMNVMAPHFGRKLVRLDTLSVLAPTDMVVFNARPGKPDLLTGLIRHEKIRLLQASLSPAQWRQLGGERGLGANDLTGEQRTLFLSLLPKPFKVRKYTVHKGGGWGFTGSAEDNEMTLSPGQRAAVRLRLNRSAQLMLPYANSQNAFTSVSSRPEGTEFWELVPGQGTDRHDRPDAFGVSIAYGVIVRQKLPNRLKPGALNFDAPALRAAVSLEDVKTVGDLVKRVGQTAGVEFIADARVAKLPVWTKGTSAGAGDILKALCYAVTGAFRKVGTIYLLTDDVAGIGTRRTLLSEWYRNAQAQEQAQREELTRRIQKQQPLQYIGYTSDDGSSLKPETLQKIEQAWNTREGRYQRHQIPLGDLPPAQQELVQQKAASQPGSQAVRTDQVIVSLRLQLSYVAPGVGVIDGQDGYYGSFQEMLPPLPPPPAAPALVSSPGDFAFLPGMTARVLYAAPANSDEATQVVGAARVRGITHVWIEAPETGKAAEILTAAITAGKRSGIPIFAVVRLLATHAAPTDPAVPLDSRDINILGETAAVWAARQATLPNLPQYVPIKQMRIGDWLRPDASGVAARLKQWLSRVAALPGLDGLVLRDTAAPGYIEPGGTSRIFYSDASDYGYTLENRVAFLRQEGIDPIDLANPIMYRAIDLHLAFFNGPGPRFMWNALRYKKNAALMADLYAALRAAHPNLPLFIRDRAAGGGYIPGGWYASWDKPDLLPRTPLDLLRGPDPIFAAARSQARRVLLGCTYYNYPTPPGATPSAMQQPYSAQSLSSQLKMVMGYKGNWNGMVIDLSEISVDKALPMLDALAPGAPKTVARPD